MSAHIFIDAENIKPEIGFRAIEKFSGEYTVEQVDIIGNETTLSSKYLEAGYNIKNCFFGKNSADTWLCTEIAKTIFEKPEVDTIIIVSSDRDFLAAIKLATDQKRKVIFVSDGNGHKNLKAMFYDLRINPDFVNLVDFKTDLEIVHTEKKKIASPPVRNDSTKSEADKIKKICKPFSVGIRNYFINHESQVKLIPVKFNEINFEVPFVDGMKIELFTNVLRNLNITQKGDRTPQVISQNKLKIVQDKVYLNISKNSNSKSNTNSKLPQNPFNDVIEYFVKHAASTKNIFIKTGNDIKEVPFINGISFDMFSRLLKGYAIAEDADKIKKIIADSFLNLQDNRIYFHSEEKFFSDLKIDFKKLSAQSLEFIKSNENKIQFFSVAHANTVHKVPFVEGMELHIFARMLHELKVCGKNASTQQILKNNGFTVKNNLVYKNQ